MMTTLSPAAPKAVGLTDSNVLEQSQQPHVGCVASLIVGPPCENSHKANHKFEEDQGSCEFTAMRTVVSSAIISMKRVI